MPSHTNWCRSAAMMLVELECFVSLHAFYLISGKGLPIVVFLVKFKLKPHLFFYHGSPHCII